MVDMSKHKVLISPGPIPIGAVDFFIGQNSVTILGQTAGNSLRRNTSTDVKIT